jgi:two-component system, OmpR family, sensor histidine kinase BaeS
MRTLRSRLILSHILPFLLVVPLVGLALIYLLQTQVMLVELSRSLENQARLVAQAVNSQPAAWSDPEQAVPLVARIQVFTDGEVLLLTPDGRPVAGHINRISARLNADELARVANGQTQVAQNYGIFQLGADAWVPVRDANQHLLGIVQLSQTLDSTTANFGRLAWVIAGLTAAEILLGCALGLVLAVRLSRPIDRAAGAVVRIASGEEVETLVPEGPEEIKRLAAAVNTLAERLRLLEETRRRSLANIVHELGRPLGAIRAAVHVVRQSPGDDAAVREELLAGVEGQIERMQPLLDDLAQLHGQVTGQIHVQCQPVAIGDWLPPVLQSWRAAAHQAGLQWEADIPRDLPTVELDVRRMAQVMGNLLSNAVKYTPPGGLISVSAGTGAGEVWISVRDTGPGIAPEERERVFEPFYRSSREQRFPQGLGLGLTIARDLVVAHGGRLVIEDGDSAGSCFTIHLPQ